MIFSELLIELQKLKWEEQRALTEEYMEIVVAKASLDPLRQVLTGYFGSPLKPEGHAPSGDASRHAKPYGGIRKDQTMYFKQDGAFCEYAFLWPWGNGTCVTVKITRAEGSVLPGGLAHIFCNLFKRK